MSLQPAANVSFAIARANSASTRRWPTIAQNGIDSEA
jgi:hypothetical protein